MPSVVQVTKTGPRTYVPAAGVSVVGGQVIEARAGGRIGPAAAGSVVVLGVALQDAIAPEQLVTEAATVNGRPVLNTALQPQNVAVAYGGTEVPVVFAAACAFGALVIAAANGQVTPAGAAPDARTIVGRCTAPNGVSGAGQVGLVRLGF